MEASVVPAVLAYKAGELFANIIRIVDEIPPGRNLSTDSLELVLRRYGLKHRQACRLSADTLFSSSGRTCYTSSDRLMRSCRFPLLPCCNFFVHHLSYEYPAEVRITMVPTCP